MVGEKTEQAVSLIPDSEEEELKLYFITIIINQLQLIERVLRSQ